MSEIDYAGLLQWPLAILAGALVLFVSLRFAVWATRKLGEKKNWDIVRSERRARILAGVVGLIIVINILPIDQSLRGQLLSLILLASVALIVFVAVEPLRRTFLPNEYHAASKAPATASEKKAEPDFEGKVFVSYRREDSQNVVDRLCDKLFERLGRDSIFRDIDSVALGRDFRGVVDKTLDECSIGVVIVGPEWLGVGADGNRRIDRDGDLVRLEVRQMLERDIPVIPVLVGNMAIPNETDLPDDLRSLVYRNAARLRPDPDFETDVERLVRGISQASD